MVLSYQFSDYQLDVNFYIRSMVHDLKHNDIRTTFIILHKLKKYIQILYFPYHHDTCSRYRKSFVLPCSKIRLMWLINYKTRFFVSKHCPSPVIQTSLYSRMPCCSHIILNEHYTGDTYIIHPVV